MAEIAAAIGYESASKFSAEFRKAYGALPTPLLESRTLLHRERRACLPS